MERVWLARLEQLFICTCTSQLNLHNPQLYEAWQGGSFVDFTLHCQGLSIPCHRIVLGARSDFFRGLLWWLLPVICISVTDDVCSVRNWRKQAGTLLLYKISMWTRFDLCLTTSTWVTLDDCEFSFFNCVNHFSDWSLMIGWPRP